MGEDNKRDEHKKKDGSTQSLFQHISLGFNVIRSNNDGVSFDFQF